MTDQATRVVPAGWYQDPASTTQVRWWNGLAWTEHVREKPGAADAGTAVAAQSTEQRIASARELERQFGISTSENEIITAAAHAGAVATIGSAVSGGSGSTGGSVATAVATKGDVSTPATGSTAAAHHAAGDPARTATGSSWLIALSPVLAVVLGIVAAYIYFYVLATPIVFPVAAIVPYLLCILWAVSDGRALKARGLTPPSPAFALLTGLGYLIVRRLRIAGSGPLIMLLIVGVLALGSGPLAFATGQLQGLSNALTIQNTISTDLIGHGEAVSVTCPAFVDTSDPGTLYTCDATKATGVVKKVWVSIDGYEGEFSYALAF